MVATVEPRVEIDDRIREQPALLDAVHSAMAYLGQSVERVPLPTAIKWRFAPLDPTSIELWMSDTPDFSGPAARRVFRASDMADDYTREVGVLRAFGDLLRLRSEQNMARIDEMIRAIDLTAYARDLSRVLDDRPESQP
jgi:hypothetical protein